MRLPSSIAVSLLFPVIACTGGERANSGQCPTGEVCSPKTPNGLHFLGTALVDDLSLSGPAPTAIGGTQDVSLKYDPGDGTVVSLNLPYTVDDDGGGGIKLDHTASSVVTILGVGSRTNYLRVLDAEDGTLFDRKQLTGAALDSIELVDTGTETTPADAQLVWAPGDQSVGIALFGQVQQPGGPERDRLVDETMTVMLAGADRIAWDTLHIPAAAAGTLPIVVTAGDKPAATIDFTVVSQADALAAIAPPTTIRAQGSQLVCFQATNTGRYIVGLSWSFTVDGVAANGSLVSHNCITVTTQKTSGTVAVQATAGGLTNGVTLAVGAMSRELPANAPTRLGNRRTTPTAGDRAAMADVMR